MTRTETTIILAVIFIILATMILPVVTVHAQISVEEEVTIVEVVVPALILSPGDTFEVDIDITPTGKNQIAGVQFDLIFDPSMVSVVSVSEGNFLSQGGAFTMFMPGTIYNEKGLLSLVVGTIITPGSYVDKSGTFATVTFKAGQREGVCLFELNGVTVGDIKGQALETRLVPAKKQFVISEEDKYKMRELIDGCLYEVYFGDEIKATIGDEKTEDFDPTVKIDKWDGKAWMELSMPFVVPNTKPTVEEKPDPVLEEPEPTPTPTKEPEPTVKEPPKLGKVYEDGDVIASVIPPYIPDESGLYQIDDGDLDKGDELVIPGTETSVTIYVDDSYMYMDEGSLEVSLTLNEQPTSNEIAFDVTSFNLDFLKQYPLTAMWDYNTCADNFGEGDYVVTFNEVRRVGNNELLVTTPVEMVNSIAVYLQDGSGGFFGNGKFCHIPRGMLYDSGSPVRTTLIEDINYTGDQLIFTIPQDFLDTATYPIRDAVGVNFGNTSIGAICANYSEGIACSGPISGPLPTGGVTEINKYTRSGLSGTPSSMKYALYNLEKRDTSGGMYGSKIVESGTVSDTCPVGCGSTISTWAGWRPAPMGTPTKCAQFDYEYMLCWIHSEQAWTCYDTGASGYNFNRRAYTYEDGFPDKLPDPSWTTWSSVMTLHSMYAKTDVAFMYLSPSSDVSRQFTARTGCTAGTHWACVDDLPGGVDDGNVTFTQQGFTASWLRDRFSHSQTTTPPYSGTISAVAMTLSALRGVFGASQTSLDLYKSGVRTSVPYVPATTPLADFPDVFWNFLPGLGGEGSVVWSDIPNLDMGYGALVTNWFGAVIVSRVYITIQWDYEDSCYYNGSPYGSHFVGPGIN